MIKEQVFSSVPVKASDIIGSEVVNVKGDVLGKIEELVVDPRTAKVAYAVVSFGGFLGVGEKLFAIPFSRFLHNVTRNVYVLDITVERLKAAPGFDPDKWPSMHEEKWHRTVCTYYERSPYWES